MCKRASTILTSQSGSKCQHGKTVTRVQWGRLLSCTVLKRGFRCFVFQGSAELAWHNNLYRAYARPASLAAREVRRSCPNHVCLAYGSTVFIAYAHSTTVCG